MASSERAAAAAAASGKGRGRETRGRGGRDPRSARGAWVMKPPLMGEPGAAAGGGGGGGRRPPPGLGTADDVQHGGKNPSRREMLDLGTAEDVRGGGSNLLLSRRESSSSSWKEARRRDPPLQQPGREPQQETINRNSFRPLREDPEEEEEELQQQLLGTNSRSLPEARERGHLRRDPYPTPRGDGGLGRGADGDRRQHLPGRERQHPRDEEEDGPGGESESEMRVSGAGGGDGSLSRTGGARDDRAGSGNRGKGGFRGALLTSMPLRKHQQQHQQHQLQHDHQQHQQHQQHQLHQKQPQPPGFVVHAEAVFKWMGVEGLTPEVLRRAKRGLREEAVAAKMWRALLRVALLHLDATRRRREAPAAALASPTTAAAAAADAPGRPGTIPDTPAAAATRSPAGGSFSGPVPVPVSAAAPPRSKHDGARYRGRIPVGGGGGARGGLATAGGVRRGALARGDGNVRVSAAAVGIQEEGFHRRNQGLRCATDTRDIAGALLDDGEGESLSGLRAGSPRLAPPDDFSRHQPNTPARRECIGVVTHTAAVPAGRFPDPGSSAGFCGSVRGVPGHGRTAIGSSAGLGGASGKGGGGADGRGGSQGGRNGEGSGGSEGDDVLLRGSRGGAPGCGGPRNGEAANAPENAKSVPRRGRIPTREWQSCSFTVDHRGRTGATTTTTTTTTTTAAATTTATLRREDVSRRNSQRCCDVRAGGGSSSHRDPTNDEDDEPLPTPEQKNKHAACRGVPVLPVPGGRQAAGRTFPLTREGLQGPRGAGRAR
ncbi:unnamed protein product [Ectocarpus sp. 6 AP-2014]